MPRRNEWTAILAGVLLLSGGPVFETWLSWVEGRARAAVPVEETPDPGIELRGRITEKLHTSNPRLDDSAFIDAFFVYLTTNGSQIIVDPEQNAVFIEDAPSGADWLDAALTDKLDMATPMAV